MYTLINPANYGASPDHTQDSSEVKTLIHAINISLDVEGKIYLSKLELNLSRECDAIKYFTNLLLINMYTQIPGGMSLDFTPNIGLE